MALKGVKVLEFAGLAPAPFCGMILADFGASVTRIDRIKSNSDMDVLGSGKKSIAVNLKTTKGCNIIKELSKNTDVIIEPFRAGVMENLGLGPDILLKENPKLIYARLTGYGQTGYYSKRAGHDINYVGLSGLLSLFGRSNDKPMFPINLTADFGGGGLMCALGIVMALFERSNSGKGQVIDNSMVEGTAYLGSWLFRSQSLPIIWGNKRGNNILDSGAHFYEVYETKDGKHISVGAIEPQFYQELINGLQCDEEDFGQFDFEKGKEVLQKLFLQKTRDEWCTIFDEKDACVFPVLSLDEVLDNKHNKENKSFFKVGSNIIPKPAPRLSRTPGESQASKKEPQVGEDTYNIMKSLGYNDKEILELNKSKIIQLFDSKL